MFDIGFSELLIIGVVALLVLGPERLPKAARFAGLWVRKARAQWYSVKSEFERELADEEMRKAIADPARDLRKQADELKRELDDTSRSAAGALRDLEAPEQRALPATAAVEAPSQPADGSAASLPPEETGKP